MEFIERYMRRAGCEGTSSYGGDVFELLERLLAAGTAVGPCVSVVGGKVFTPRGVVVFEDTDFESVRRLKGATKWLRWVLGLESSFSSPRPLMVRVGRDWIRKENLYGYEYVVYRVGKSFLLKDGTSYVGKYFDVRVVVGHDVFGEKPVIGLYPPLTERVMQKILSGRPVEPSDLLPGFRGGRVEDGWIVRGERKVRPSVTWFVNDVSAYVPYVDGLAYVQVPYDYEGVDFWSAESLDDVPGDVLRGVFEYCLEDAEYYAVREEMGDVFVSFGKDGRWISASLSGFFEVDGVKMFVPFVGDVLSLCSFDDVLYTLLLL